MKKQITLIALLVATFTGKLFAGGPSAPDRFDSTFAQNGFLIDTLTGGASFSFIYFNEIMVSRDAGTLNQFWIGGTTNSTYLANKYSPAGNQLFSRTGLDQAEGSGNTGVLLSNKVYLGGQANTGGHYQNIALNFDGSNHSIFHQTIGPDSFLTEAIYASGKPVGQSASNCSDVLSNGHIVTLVIKYNDSTYITDFNPVAGTTVTTYPQLTNGNTSNRVVALRTMPGTNNWVALVYNTTTMSSTLYLISQGALISTYTFTNTRYNAMIFINGTEILLGGDNLRIFNVGNSAVTIPAASLSNVLQLTRNEQTGEIYAFTGSQLYALTSAVDFDNTYNPDGLGNNFSYTYVNADYWMNTGSNPNAIFYTDMEMQGNDILISGFANTLNGQPVNSGMAGFVIKIRGKGSVPNACANFSVQLDSVYGTGGCDWNAHITLSGTFPMTAYINWTGGGSTVTVTASPFIPTGLCPETYEIVFEDQNSCIGIVNFVTPPPCTAPAFSTQLGGSVNFCEATPLQLGPLSVSGNPTSYQWYKNNTPIIGANAATFLVANCSVLDFGSYFVIAENSCGTDTAGPVAVSIVQNAKPDILQSGNLLSATNYSPNNTFQWYLNGTAISGATNLSYTATQSGTYSVAATNGNCSQFSDDLSVTVTGVEESAFAGFSIYPNPASETLIVTSSTEVEAIHVYNALGEEVKHLQGQVSQINIADISNGVYTLQLLTKPGNSAVKKFIKE